MMLNRPQKIVTTTSERSMLVATAPNWPLSCRYSSAKNTPITTGMKEMGRSSASITESSRSVWDRLVQAFMRPTTNRAKSRRITRKTKKMKSAVMTRPNSMPNTPRFQTSTTRAQNSCSFCIVVPYLWGRRREPGLGAAARERLSGAPIVAGAFR